MAAFPVDLSGLTTLVSDLASGAKARGTVWGYRAAWTAVRRMPERAAYGAFDAVADLMVRRGGKGLARMRANYAKVRPDLDDNALDVAR